MATSKTRRASRASAARSRVGASKRRTPAVRRPAPKAAAHRRPPVRRSPSKRGPVKTDVSGAATAVLKSFVKLLTSLRTSAAQLSTAQRAKLQRALKHAHAALG